MKSSVFIKSLVFALVVCFGLAHAGYAQTPVSSVTLSNIIGDSPVKTGNYYPYTDTASLNFTDNTGEQKSANPKWVWTAVVRWYDLATQPNNAPYGPCPAGTDYQFLAAPPASPMPAKTDKPDPSTTLQVKFGGAGFYKITLTATCTFDIQDKDGNTISSGNQVSGSIDCLINVNSKDFSITAAPDPGPSLTLPLESSGNVLVTLKTAPVAQTPDDEFNDDVSLSLIDKTDNQHPVSAPVGVSSTTATVNMHFHQQADLTVSVGGNAVPGDYPLTIYGISGANVQHPSLQNTATVALTIPKRYVEIDGPFDPNTNNKSKNGLNTRNNDGSIAVDTVISDTPPSTGDGGIPNGGPYWFSGPFSAVANGFLDAKTYIWYGKGTMQAYTLLGGAGGPGQQTALPVETPTTKNSGDLYFSSGTAPTLTSPITTTVSVDVKNTNGSIITSNSYLIRFHQPYEFVKSVGNAVDDNPNSVLSSKPATSANNPARPNSHFQVYYDPSTVEIDESGASKFAGLLAAAASGAVTVRPLASKVPGWVGPVLTVLSYALGTYAPSSPDGKQVPHDASYSEFIDSLITQKKIDNNNLAGIAQPQLARWTSRTNLLSDTATSVLSNSADINHDPDGHTNSWFQLRKGTVTVSCRGLTFRLVQHWTGDVYTTNGYAGPANGALKKPGIDQWIFQWVLQSTNPNPSP